MQQVIAEMIEALKKTSNRSEGVNEVNYYLNNRLRMKYKEYRDSGMLWNKADNEKVLKLRLAKLNGPLSSYFVPKPQSGTLASEPIPT